MTDEVTITLITGTVTVLLAGIAAVVSVRNGKKVDAVKEQTNGDLTKLTAELEAANATIAGMSKTMEKIAPTDR